MTSLLFTRTLADSHLIFFLIQSFFCVCVIFILFVSSASDLEAEIAQEESNSCGV